MCHRDCTERERRFYLFVRLVIGDVDDAREGFVVPLLRRSVLLAVEGINSVIRTETPSTVIVIVV